MVSHHGHQLQLVFHKVLFWDLFFPLYILNNLSNGLLSTTKLFADDTLLFLFVHGANKSTGEKNTDLDLILKWTYQWKMSFKPDKSEQIEEVGFPRKSSKVTQF